MLTLNFYAIRKSYCRRCLACQSNCPRQAIVIGSDGFPFIDQSLCNACGQCLRDCKLRAVKKSFRPTLRNN